MNTMKGSARPGGSGPGAEDIAKGSRPQYSSRVTISPGDNGVDLLICERASGAEIFAIPSAVIDAARAKLPHARPFVRSLVLPFRKRPEAWR